MISRTIRIAIATLFALAVASTALVAQGGAQAAGSLLVDGITTQATPIYAFGLSVTNTGAPVGGGGGAGKAEISNIEVTRLSDAASPQLFRAAVLGMHIASVRIDLFKSGPGTSASSYVLHDALVTGFGNANGLETVAFAFRSVEVTAGGVTYCFDLATNASC
jgi:Type VI secretion system effector, Hcp